MPKQPAPTIAIHAPTGSRRGGGCTTAAAAAAGTAAAGGTAKGSSSGIAVGGGIGVGSAAGAGAGTGVAFAAGAGAGTGVGATAGAGATSSMVGAAAAPSRPPIGTTLDRAGFGSGFASGGGGAGAGAGAERGGGLGIRRCFISASSSGTCETGSQSSKPSRQHNESSVTAPVPILRATSSRLIGPTGTSLIATYHSATGRGASAGGATEAAERRNSAPSDDLRDAGRGPACEPPRRGRPADGRRDCRAGIALSTLGPRIMMLCAHFRHFIRKVRPAIFSSGIWYFALQLSQRNFIRAFRASLGRRSPHSNRFLT